MTGVGVGLGVVGRIVFDWLQKKDPVGVCPSHSDMEKSVTELVHTVKSLCEKIDAIITKHDKLADDVYPRLNTVERESAVQAETLKDHERRIGEVEKR